jgi:hypothetical protein
VDKKIESDTGKERRSTRKSMEEEKKALAEESESDKLVGKKRIGNIELESKVLKNMKVIGTKSQKKTLGEKALPKLVATTSVPNSSHVPNKSEP